MQRPGAGEQFSAIHLGLLCVQGIVILPKLSLLARASSRFGRTLSLRVDFPQREVEIGQLYPAVVLREKFVQSALALLAKGALKVRDVDLRPQRVGVNLAGLLQLKLL